jgi:hypothetical protein
VNIFVGNLAFTTTEQDLRQLFEPYGTVDTIRIMTDRETGRSRGFGSSRCRTGAQRKAPLTPSMARHSPAAPLQSTKHGRGNRAVSRASRAGRRRGPSPPPARTTGTTATATGTLCMARGTQPGVGPGRLHARESSRPARPQRAARRVRGPHRHRGWRAPTGERRGTCPRLTAPVVVVLSGLLEARSTLPAAGGAITSDCGPTSL